MDCPRCGLFNPPEAQRCDCGYDFVKGTVEQAYFRQALPKELKPAVVVIVLWSGRKVDADVRAVQLLLNDERRISDEVQRLLLAQMLVVIRAARAEQMRRSRVFREIVAGCAHHNALSLPYAHDDGFSF